MDLTVDLCGGDAGLDSLAADLQRHRRKPAGVPELIQLTGCFQYDHVYASRIFRIWAVMAPISWVPSTVWSLPALR